MLEKIDGSKQLTYEAKGNVVFGASTAVLTRLKTMKPAVREDLATKFKNPEDPFDEPASIRNASRWS
jgi:hypothetical protein